MNSHRQYCRTKETLNSTVDISGWVAAQGTDMRLEHAEKFIKFAEPFDQLKRL
jgi:hypothetical protein